MTKSEKREERTERVENYARLASRDLAELLVETEDCLSALESCKEREFLRLKAILHGQGRARATR